jgi:hypothetical protein
MTLLDDSPLHIKLIPPTDGGMIFRAGSQAGFKVFYDQLLSSGAQITPIVFTMDSGASIGGLVGEFLLSGKQLIGVALGAAMTEWFKGQSGRRLELNIGDIKIEAATSDEVARLLEQAVALREAH